MPPRAASALAARARAHPVRTAIAVLVTLWLVGAGYDAWQIRADLDTGQQLIRDLELSTVSEDGGLVHAAERAAGHLDRAHHRATGSPFLAVMAPIPVLGDQIQGVRDLAGHADRLGEAALPIAVQVQDDLERARSEPAARVDLVATVRRELGPVEELLDEIILDPGADGFVLGPVAAARDTFVAQLVEARRDVQDARRFAAGLERMLAGPSRYLVFAANNAEHGGATGMLLSVGTMDIVDGDFTSGEFRNAPELNLKFFDLPGGVPVPDVLRRIYHPYSLHRDFVSAGLNPHFPSAGRNLAAIAAAGPIGRVDGVISIDAVALQAVMEVIGPIEVDGVTITPDNIIDTILNENYQQFTTPESRFERYEVQGDIAAGIVDALKTSDASIVDLADALTDASKARHVLAWSPDPDLQGLFERTGVAGAMQPDGLLINMINLSANKLDYFIQPTATMSVERVAGGDRLVTLAVTVENEPRPPELTSPYIEGFGTCCAEPGDHRVMIDLHLPASAYEATALDVGFTGHGRFGPNQILTLANNTPLGTTSTVRASFHLPGHLDHVTLIPDGRLHPIQLTYDGRTYVADQTRVIPLG